MNLIHFEIPIKLGKCKRNEKNNDNKNEKNKMVGIRKKKKNSVLRINFTSSSRNILVNHARTYQRRGLRIRSGFRVRLSRYTAFAKCLCITE